MWNIKPSFFKDYYRIWLWVPIFLSIGIGIYFSLEFEPSLWIGLALSSIILILIFATRFSPFVVFTFLISLGFLISQLRTHTLSTPMIDKAQYSVNFKGEIISLESLATDEKRIILSINNNQLVRLKIKGPSQQLQIGDKIGGNGHLFPFTSPLIEGTYHFRRQAFFQGLSAQGVLYGQTISINPSSTESGSLQKFRRLLTEKIYSALPGEKGAIAAALITGEKTKISKNIRDDYVNSGLSHILAISGLHVGLVAGFIYFLLRNIFLLLPRLNLYWHTKKVAAMLCIPFIGLYMTIAGFGTPVIRSFIMTSIVLLGVLIDRISISLNLVAIAAFCILVIFPESLLHPSFQLSFAAVFALIAVYEFPRLRNIHNQSGIKKYVFYLVSLALTSGIASLATFPLTISTFNRFTIHAIEANMLGVPLMGFWIMPLGALGVFLMPIHSEWLPLQLMGEGIEFLNKIAHTVSQWKGSNIIVETPPLWSTLSVIFGALWIGIWQQKIRYLSIPLLCLGIFGFIHQPAQPIFFFDPDQKAWALRDGPNFYTSSSNKKFEIELWARNLGIENIHYLDSSSFESLTFEKYNITVILSKYISRCPKNQAFSCYTIKKCPSIITKRGLGYFKNQKFIFVENKKNYRLWD